MKRKKRNLVVARAAAKADARVRARRRVSVVSRRITGAQFAEELKKRIALAAEKRPFAVRRVARENVLEELDRLYQVEFDLTDEIAMLREVAVSAELTHGPRADGKSCEPFCQLCPALRLWNERLAMKARRRVKR